MNARDFFEKVSQMRNYQKLYFKTKSKNALIQSKELERQIDDEISRVNKLLGRDVDKEPKQGSLF